MGFLRRLFGQQPSAPPPPPRPVELLQGGGRVNAVGESQYQPALQAIAGPGSTRSHSVRVQALLLPEPNNPVDPRAIVIQVGGRTVGYLMRADRDAFEERVLSIWRAGKVAGCAATISGGWIREGGDVGMYGISLDLRDLHAERIQAVLPSIGELAGLTVCFTGPSACTFNGRLMDRTTQELLALRAGLVVLPRVTKKLRILVMADSGIHTGKTAKAAEYGTRVMGEREFWVAVGVPID